MDKKGKKNFYILTVKVKPNQPKNKVTKKEEKIEEGFINRFYSIDLAASPIRNKANDELISFLSKELCVSKSDIVILSGKTSSLKRLKIFGELSSKSTSQPAQNLPANGSVNDPLSSNNNKENNAISNKSNVGNSSTLDSSDYYYQNGFMVFTSLYHLKRGYCCKNNCRHCPYPKK